MNLFTRPTLVTLTAPTCAGKNFLLEALVKIGFERIVSTTDRAPRAGEVEGVHYNFISTEQSRLLEVNNMFAELVTYNGTRYGVTHAEMNRKMTGSKPPVVILEPCGLRIYSEYCKAHNWELISIYVSTEEHIRLQRLTARTVADIMSVIEAGATVNAVTNVVEANNKRMKAIFDDERTWPTEHKWDLVVDGTNVTKAIEQILQFKTDQVNHHQ